MKFVRERVSQFNRNTKDPYYRLTFDKPVSEVQITKIQKYFKLKIPMSLRWFYREFGGLGGNADEYVLNIENIPHLLKKLNEPNKWFRCDSLGLIDYMRFLWGNDIPKMDDVMKEKVMFINENYRCFGHYRYNCELDEANLLYFDMNGRFGEVRYYEAEFDTLWEDYLHPMFSESPANEELEHMIVRILNVLEKGVKNRKVDGYSVRD